MFHCFGQEDTTKINWNKILNKNNVNQLKKKTEKVIVKIRFVYAAFYPKYLPQDILQYLNNSFASVDLPQPVAPTTAVTVPGSITKSMSSRTGFFSL